ncbi:MAG: hypothetical protein AAFP00_10360, partial [Bacteroidota bacterium]
MKKGLFVRKEAGFPLMVGGVLLMLTTAEVIPGGCMRNYDAPAIAQKEGANRNKKDEETIAMAEDLPCKKGDNPIAIVVPPGHEKGLQTAEARVVKELPTADVTSEEGGKASLQTGISWDDGSGSSAAPNLLKGLNNHRPPSVHTPRVNGNPYGEPHTAPVGHKRAREAVNGDGASQQPNGAIKVPEENINSDDDTSSVDSADDDDTSSV